jgi:N-acetylglucosaminyldiphosphoundecaprenol N-acetyl-beta-D-mannosaminyltransferase
MACAARVSRHRRKCEANVLQERLNAVRTVDVLGVRISVIDQERAREILFNAIHTGRRAYVTVTGVHGVMEAQDDLGFRAILNNSLLTTPDGMPMVWMGKLQGERGIARVYGPDLMLNLCEHSRAENFSHFFYGGTPGVADDLARKLRILFPGLNIAGTFTPPFRPLGAEELSDLQRRVRLSRPDFFWVGLSTPKQERFMATYLELLPEVKIMIGIGAAFDLLTGRVRQAPGWMQRCGLEWFYRLIQEPRRLGRRYLVNNPRFILLATAQLAKEVLHSSHLF